MAALSYHIMWSQTKNFAFNTRLPPRPPPPPPPFEVVIKTEDFLRVKILQRP